MENKYDVIPSASPPHTHRRVTATYAHHHSPPTRSHPQPPPRPHPSREPTVDEFAPRLELSPLPADSLDGRADPTLGGEHQVTLLATGLATGPPRPRLGAPPLCRGRQAAVRLVPIISLEHLVTLLGGARRAEAPL